MTRTNRDDVSLERLIEVLNSCQKLTQDQEVKYTAMYKLAREVKLGRIVELGTHLGLGTISLCFGARARGGVPIYVDTVDWYQNCVGMDGEEYHKSDEKVMRSALDIANIIPITHISTFKRAAADWSYPIGLLVWDGNVFLPDDDICDWEHFVLPGGKIAFYERISGVGLASHRLAERYVNSGWYAWVVNHHPNTFSIIKRLGNGVDK